MPIINRIAEFHDDMKTWRRHLHANPELGYELHETAAFVIERLREFGVDEIHEGIAETGLVAIINGRGDGPTIGLRADMDALPITEIPDRPHKSRNQGVMHACGHDGHTAMLLGAARYLAETRNFKGRVALIFQPAEEGGAGGEAMVKAGIMDDFAVKQVFGIHNFPGMPEGLIGTRPGPLLAAADEFQIDITGKGGHAAMPNTAVDPVMIAVQIAQALQTIVSRNVDPIDSAVISVTRIDAGTTHNIIPGTAFMQGTVRTVRKETQADIVARMERIVTNIATALGGEAKLNYHYGYPPTVNHPAETEFALNVAREVAGEQLVTDDIPPTMGAEDFAYMLEARPGAFLCLGTGEGAGLHHPEFDFNDEVSPIGASFFVRLVETAQPVG